LLLDRLPKTLSNWRFNGAGIPHKKIAGVVRYELRALAQWLLETNKTVSSLPELAHISHVRFRASLRASWLKLRLNAVSSARLGRANEAQSRTYPDPKPKLRRNSCDLFAGAFCSLCLLQFANRLATRDDNWRALAWRSLRRSAKLSPG
jgi:hypothetical protein